MNDKEIPNSVTKSIKEEERKNEGIIHLARISVFSLVLIVMSLSRLALGEVISAILQLASGMSQGKALLFS